MDKLKTAFATISEVDGINIRMHTKEKGHEIPHFHAMYAGHEISIKIGDYGKKPLRGDIGKGGFSPAKYRKVLKWMKDYENELWKDWELVEANKIPKKIEPIIKKGERISLVKAVEYLEGYVLKLFFDNGRIKVIDLEDDFLNEDLGIFSELRNIEYFKKVKCDGDTIYWPNEYDICPTYLYDMGIDWEDWQDWKKPQADNK